jgi:hypothetical protein
MNADATATVAVRVDVAREDAFALFVHEVDAWWRRGPKFRHGRGDAARITIEPHLHGRVVETWTEGEQAREFELGRVTCWRPPERFAFSFRNATFAAAERTEVEVTFATVDRGTLVTVRHAGWSALRADHPSKHGLEGAAFARDLGLWWGDQMASLRVLAAGRL